MIAARGYAALKPGAPLTPFAFERRDPGEKDVLIDILFCGICHSDIHQTRDEWGGGTFPMVPGHEIVGRVTRVGTGVTRFKAGDIAGVGCFVDSCRRCDYCRDGREVYCDRTVFTYGSLERDGKTLTRGGYSSQIVVDENYVLKIPPGLPLDRAAPLLCAGITTYSPLKHWKIAKGHRVGILGLGGLGHMAVKYAASFGAEVTVLSSSKHKEADAWKLGAQTFVWTGAPDAAAKLAVRFDFIVDTVSAPHDINAFLAALKVDGTLILVGASPKPHAVEAFSLIMRRRCLAGSLIGGIPETQEMLDYSAAHGTLPDVEVIPPAQINAAFDRAVQGRVRYRFVIDMKTL